MKVGQIVRIEWDSDTDEMNITMRITDDSFKRRVLNGKKYEDLLTISGEDVMVVASKEKDE